MQYLMKLKYNGNPAPNEDNLVISSVIDKSSL